MSLEKVINILAGRPKNYDILDRDTSNALEKHAHERMNDFYSSVGEKTSTDWTDIEHEMYQGPGTLKTSEDSYDFAEGLGLMPFNPSIFQGQQYEVDEGRYSIFYFEPSNDTVVVEETRDQKLLASEYVLGETLNFSNLNNGYTNYTFAELRKPEEPLERPLEPLPLHNL